MVRLLRPYIPISVRLQVIERQIAQAGRATIIFRNESQQKQLRGLLAFMFGATDVHLDHDPPLGAREKIFENGEHVGYRPDANDPEFLIYREANLHRLKTNVAGEHGQHPDRVLIKKQRRIERGPRPKRGPKIRSRGFEKRSGKTPWPKRKF